MAVVDVILVITWLTIVFIVGIRAGIRENFEGFWANERRTRSLLLVTTIVATQVGAGTIIGITSSTFQSGTGFGLVALVSTVTGFVAVGLMSSRLKTFGDRFRAITLSEIFRERFGRSTQLASAAVLVIAYASLLAGQYVALSHLLSTWTGADMRLALAFATVGLVIYTAFAGLKGDIATDFLQFWMKSFLVFLVIIPVLAMRYPIASLLSSLPAAALSPVTFGGVTYLVAGVLLGAIIPVVSMELWMRVYASTSAAQAKRVFLWSAAMVAPFYIAALLIGLIARAIYRPGIPADRIFFMVMVDHLPTGLLGIALGGVFAVVLSAANTMILVIGSTLVRDFAERRGADDETGSVRLSRLVTAGAGIVGAILAYGVPNIVQLMLNAFFMIAVLAPSLIGVFVWRRATRAGATASIVLGSIVTLVALPFAPQQAFVPGLVCAIVAFVAGSFLSRHANSERTPEQLFEAT